jgi:acyl-CoA reductase-like NAD-dependent aldehyde dehydrogenase
MRLARYLDSSTAAVDAGDVTATVARARRAQRDWAGLSGGDRARVIAGVRAALEQRAGELAQLACDETGMGRVEDKREKNLIAVRLTPGPEALDDDPAAAACRDERRPLGVIASFTPSTNPVATVINNAISMLSAGNAVVFHPHPGAVRCAAIAAALIDAAVIAAGGPAATVAVNGDRSAAAVRTLMADPGVNAIVVTGAAKMLAAAFAHGKKVIGAGPGNPPAVVDASADVAHAARCLIDGASFDNNLMCIAEKSVIAERAVAGALRDALVAGGVCWLGADEVARATELLVDRSSGMPQPNRGFVGRPARTILAQLGRVDRDDVRLIACDVPADHPLVMLELMMPVLPVVEVASFDDALATAVRVEQGFGHTAMIHSSDPDHIDRLRAAIDPTVFAVNAPSVAVGKDSFFSFTIASPTGEGMTSCRSFTRLCRVASAAVP